MRRGIVVTKTRAIVGWLACCLCAALQATGAEPSPEHPPALSPAESAARFKVADGLAISLVAAEPDVTQPLSISFDDRGRMWVLQYRQYPNPEGLTAVEMDHWLRTRYDKLPDPPPKGPKGQDRISIYEDRDGDGHAERVKPFISDLNLASGMALGHGGVFVVQPPYLLFYADRDRNDVPDGPPEVLLSGFGMEDAHAFANSLTWGPDGWLYGAQGSTATARIRGVEFQQGVWRYHPLSKRFELFAEGGGNSWGVEFDRFGNLFAAGNTVEPLVHHVQGAYYVKGFGKHGPLHNPHAYGYFQPVVHHGYVGDSLTGGAILYQGGAFPSRFNDACIAPNTRHSACRWSTVETRGSTFATRAAGDFVLSDDIWFRPVDMTVGPDGAVYIADWYDYNISHSSPTNRSQWYQPSRLDGRVWRVAPPRVKPVAAGSIDLAQKSSAELIELLSNANDWYARAARRLLAERRDPAVLPVLERLALESADQRLALQGLWSAYVTAGAIDESLAASALASHHEYVRAWTVRLLGDAGQISPPLAETIERMAREDASVVVRSQLACSAKRLSAGQCLAIVAGLLHRDEDVDDPHLPLLLWWAIEDKAMSDAPLVLQLLESPSAWRLPLVRGTIVERLARRYAADDSDTAFVASSQLLQLAITSEDKDLVVSGMLQGLAGRKLQEVPFPLIGPIADLFKNDGENPRVVELGLRMSVPEAEARALKTVSRASAPVEDRVALVKCLGETRDSSAINALLALLSAKQPEPLQIAALGALGYFNQARISEVILQGYSQLTPGAQARAIELLCTRRNWALDLLLAIDAKMFPPTVLPLEQLQRLRDKGDSRLVQLVAKNFGRVQPSTPLEKQGRITAVTQVLAQGPGNAAGGREQFEKHCANCHKLHGAGSAVGPDLTGADRKNRDLLARNIIDPSSIIREEFVTHVATTNDGRVLTGLLAESSAQTLTILDAKNKRTTLSRAELEELRESDASLMPDNLLDQLSEQQIRDLFAYLQSNADKP
jgi:putative membrane-bound dehydrogenase-like protein